MFVYTTIIGMRVKNKLTRIYTFDSCSNVIVDLYYNFIFIKIYNINNLFSFTLIYEGKTYIILCTIRVC